MRLPCFAMKCDTLCQQNGLDLPVGLGEEGGVDDGEADSDGELLDAADDVGGFDHEQEGHRVAHEGPHQEDVGELPPAGLHHGRVVVPAIVEGGGINWHGRVQRLEAH